MPKIAAKSFHQIIVENAMQWPERTYVHCVDQQKSLTYGALYRVSNQVAQFLKEYDIQANDRVLLLSENSVENLAVFVSVLRYGATLATVHVEMNQSHLSEIINAIAPKIVLYQEGLGLEGLQASAPGVWLALGEWGSDNQKSTGWFAEIAALSDEDNIKTVAGPNDHGVIFYNSGTVAKTKGVIQTHATAYFN